MDKLPPEILVMIFAHSTAGGKLTAAFNRVVCRAVCREWREYIPAQKLRICEAVRCLIDYNRADLIFIILRRRHMFGDIVYVKWAIDSGMIECVKSIICATRYGLNDALMESVITWVIRHDMIDALTWIYEAQGFNHPADAQLVAAKYGSVKCFEYELHKGREIIPYVLFNILIKRKRSACFNLYAAHMGFVPDADGQYDLDDICKKYNIKRGASVM